MNILILHRIPYFKIEYHRGINHHIHNVIYIGNSESLASLPDNLPCERITVTNDNLEHSVHDYIKTRQFKFDRIISLSEYDLMLAAELRKIYKIFGPKPEEVVIVRNKLIMKAALSDAGIAVPEFAPLTDIFSNIDFSHRGAVVIKPVDGASSENVIICENIAEAKQLIKNNQTGIYDLDKNIRPLNDFEMEEYVFGNILHIDGLVMKGKIRVCIASQYVGTCLDYAKGKPLGSIQLGTADNINSWAQRCIHAAKISNGSFHLEAIDTKHGLVFLEIANRVGGADVVKTFELATGIHMPSAELRLMLDDEVNVSPIFSKNKYGWFVFPGHHIESGFANISSYDSFVNHPFIKEWHQLNNSQPCKKKISYQPNEVPISGILQGKDHDELITFTQKMFSSIKIVDKEYALKDVA